MASYYEKLVNNVKKGTGNLQKNIANAGGYVRNLMGNVSPVIPKIGDYYGQIYDAKERVRDGINDKVADAIRAGVDMLPDNIEQPIERVGGYVDRLVGGEGIEKALSLGENMLARKLLGPVATADRIYGIFREAGQKAGENNPSLLPVTPSGNATLIPPAEAGTPKAEPMSSTQPARTAVPRNYLKQGTETPPASSVTDGGTGGVQRVYVANDVGGSGGDEPGEVNYEKYLSNKENEYESAAGKYNADIDYAKGVKDDAYREAEDEYRIAMRDADANYRTSLPTYGSAAEEMLDKGLAGSGYTEYLMGKALKAKSDEAMAARSQMSYQKMLADKQYNSDVKDALNERYQTELALDGEYKAKFQEVVTGIMNGLWDASVGERILSQYAPEGGVSEEIRSALADVQSNYDNANQGTILGAYIDWCRDNGAEVNAATISDYLKKTGKFTDGQISSYISNVFDANGNFLGDTNTETNTITGGGLGTGNTGNIITETDTTQDYKTQASELFQKVYGRLPSTDELEECSKKMEKYTQGMTDMQVADLFGITQASVWDPVLEDFQLKIASHKIGSNELWDILDEMKADKDAGLLSSNAYNDIKAMCDGLVVSNVTLKSNGGLRKKYQKGDQFEVELGHETYRVRSEGETSDKAVIEAAKGLKDGTVFGYGTNLFIKVGDSAYRFGARAVFGNGEYDKLWHAIYKDAVADISQGYGGTLKSLGYVGTGATEKENTGESENTNNGSTGAGSSDSDSIEYDGKTYEIGGKVSGDPLTQIMGFLRKDGEIFENGGKYYIKKSGDVYWLALKQDDNTSTSTEGTESGLTGELLDDSLVIADVLTPGVTINSDYMANIADNKYEVTKSNTTGKINENTGYLEVEGIVDENDAPIRFSFAKVTIVDEDLLENIEENGIKEGDVYRKGQNIYIYFGGNQAGWIIGSPDVENHYGYFNSAFINN